MTRRADVVVVGAGPTGLAVALQARAGGADVRVLERRPQAWRPSRALLIHSRTLEVLRPLNVVDRLLARADTSPRICLHIGSRTVPLRPDPSALGGTAFTHLTLHRQADLEAVLAAELADRGVEVERGVTVASVDQHPDDGVRVALRSATGPTDVECGHLVGCDGAASVVRSEIGVGFPGFSYRTEVVLADVDLDTDLEPRALHVAVGRAGLLFVFPVGEQATWRMLATRPASGAPDRAPGELGPPVAASELDALLDASPIGARVGRVAWSSQVRVAHRLADAYRRGRVFLAGDAAHVHSPAGGQGMNTGIQDGINLGWKLAYAARGPTTGVLLASYEQERRPVARQVAAWTDLIFWAEAGRDPVASLVRGLLAPMAAPLVPLALGRRRVAAEIVRFLAQLRVDYRGSPLSVQRSPHRSGRLRAGDRLADATVTAAGRAVRLHDLTARPGVHVLLHDGGPPLPDPDRPDVLVHRLDGWTGPALMAVRPDGYVGLCSDTVDGGELSRWLSLVGAPPGTTA